MSDEWRQWSAYSCLKNMAYDHRTVDQSKSFVDPTTGAIFVRTGAARCALAAPGRFKYI